jgi:Zn-dependent protease
MTDQPEGRLPAAPPWTPGEALPDVYPPPPEYYEQRAQAAPAFVTPGEAPGHEWRPLREEARRRRRFAPIRYPHQPITTLDVAWTFLSAAVSFVVYAVLLGWPVGLGLTALLFVHEMGHYVVARAKRLPARLPIFVPFLGAFVLTALAGNARDDAEIALAGPFAGALGSLACFVAWRLTLQPDLLTIALINLLINLFNLAPVSPLDGGRAARVISRKQQMPTLSHTLMAGLSSLDIVLILVAAFGMRQVYLRPSDAVLLRTETTRKERRYLTLLYFGLIGAMLAGPLAVVALTLAALGPGFWYILPEMIPAIFSHLL